ncbi:MAG: hypothetical protein R3Y12_07310 [Clostridia bacterium]
MTINGAQQASLASQLTNVSTTATTNTDYAETAPITAVSTVSSEVDTFEYSQSFDVYGESGVYTSSEGMSSEAIDLDKLASESMQNFQNMLIQMVGGQINAFTSSTYVNLSVTAEESAAALESISEGGAYSPENVANNILDMAKALSGGDPEKFELLKEAVIDGFEAAAGEWGDEMPSITSETYDLVMQGFDTWQNEINGTAVFE